jgi:hypothetical protein
MGVTPPCAEFPPVDVAPPGFEFPPVVVDLLLLDVHPKAKNTKENAKAPITRGLER